MNVLGIDPGPEKSGFCIFNTDARIVVFAGEMLNEEMLFDLRHASQRIRQCSNAFIETIEPMGLPVGKSTLETMRIVGRMQEAWETATGSPVGIVRRGDEKITLCGAATYMDPNTKKRRSVTDAQIRQAIIDRFPATGGGKTPQVGTRKAPGPLYGVKGHAWSALAVVLTGLETA